MTSLDKILIAILVLASGVHCSNTNSEKIAKISFVKPQVPPVYELNTAFNFNKIRLIDDFFKNKNTLSQFSGSFLFYDSGSYYANAYGYANGKLKTVLKPEMPFQIASVSKTLTSYTILSLIDQGKLELNMNVNQLIPEFPYKQITVAHLLSHKSGIPNYMYFAETYFKTKYRRLTNEDVVWMLKRYRPKLEFTPNSRYKYSNTNYVLLAYIVEKITKLPFERYMEDSVFKIIGMNNSTIFTPAMKLEDQQVQGHNGMKSIFTDHYQNGTMGDKGVYTSVFDLLKFDLALRRNLLISPSTLKDACTPHTPCRPTKDYYGYGWRIRYYENGDTIIYHNGWWQGFKSYFIRWQNKDRCIIVLTNTINGGFIKQADLINLMEGNKPTAIDAVNEAD